MRENSGSWIIKFILGLIIIAFVGIGVGTYGSRDRQTVATIGKQSVTLQEYQDSYRQIVEQLRTRFGDYLTEDTLKMFNVEQQAIDRIIETHLIEEQADRFDLIVSDEEIRDQLMSIDAFKDNGVFSFDRYRQILGYQRTTPELFEARLKRDLRNQKVQEMVVNAVTVSDMEVRDWYVYENTTVALDFIKIDPETMEDVEPSPEEITAYYEENRDRYKTAPKRVASYLRYSPDDYRKTVTVSEEQIRVYYETHEEEFNTPARAEARHILIKTDENDDEAAAIEAAREKALELYERAVAGEDFAELARSHSEGPSAEAGGYIGAFSRGEMVEPFEDVAFALKSGEISKPVKTRFGWHVIKVEQQFPSEVTPLEQARDSIEYQIVDREALSMAYEDAGKAFDAVIEGDDLEQAGLVTGQKVVKTQSFTQDGAGLILEDSQAFAREAFSLSSGIISDVKSIGNSYYLIKVTDIISPAVQPLEAVKEQVVKDLTARMKQEKAKKLSESILSESGGSLTLAKIADTHGLELESTGPFVRTGPIEELGSSPELLKAAFELQAEKEVYPSVLSTQDGFYIIALKEKTVPDPSVSDDDLDDVRNEILTAKQNQVFRTWLDELREKSDISINPNLFN